MRKPFPAQVRKLREIAAKVKEWEDRDLRETGASSRPGYFADLFELADMFDGTDARFIATVKPKGGWPRTAQNTLRDFEIAEFMHERRQQPDYRHADALAAALKQFRNVSEKTIERADTRFRSIMDSDADKELILMFEILAACRQASIKRA